MSTFLKRVSACFSGSPSTGYELLSTKKDDDAGVEEAKSWVELHKVQTDISSQPIAKIHQYADSIIASLKQVTLTHANQKIIENHLLKIATYSNFVKEKMVKQIPSCKGDKQVKEQILVSFATLIPYFP